MVAPFTCIDQGHLVFTAEAQSITGIPVVTVRPTVEVRFGYVPYTSDVAFERVNFFEVGDQKGMSRSCNLWQESQKTEITTWENF